MKKIDFIQIVNNLIVIGEQLDNASLVPGENCYLTVNGKKMTSPVRVTPGDAVTWHVQNPTPSSLFELSMSQDRLHVLLTVYENYHTNWRAQLDSGHDGTVVNCVPEMDLTRPVTAADVIQQYRDQKFQARLDHAAIERALREKSQKPVVIASGEAAIEGKNGWIEPHFSSDEEIPFEQSGDKLNYREKRRIPVIHRNECMATIHPPATGKPGTDVRGELIPPRPAHAVNYRLQHNVYEKDGKVYAAITGRPSITAGTKPILDIVPVYTVTGNVDLETGHVRFAGDVIVHGNVMETMKVTAAHRLIVHGGVYGATLVAGGSIHVDQNIRKSQVFAGQYGTITRRLQQPLTKLVEQIKAADQSRQQLQDAAAKKQQMLPAAGILQYLLKHNYPDLLKRTQELVQFMASSATYLPEELSSLQETLERLITESHSQLQITTWQTARQQLERWLNEQAASYLQGESITTQTADISHLEVDGDVIFNGKGSTQSNIVASKRILFTKRDASCRGGRLEAGERIVAERLGSFHGSKTECRAGYSIAARNIQHCDIQIEGLTQYVEEETNIEYFREDGQTLFRHFDPT